MPPPTPQPTHPLDLHHGAAQRGEGFLQLGGNRHDDSKVRVNIGDQRYHKRRVVDLDEHVPVINGGDCLALAHVDLGGLRSEVGSLSWAEGSLLMHEANRMSGHLAQEGRRW